MRLDVRGLLIGRGVATASAAMCVFAVLVCVVELSSYVSGRSAALVSAQNELDREAAVVAERLDGILQALTLVLDGLAAAEPGARRDSAALRKSMPLVPEVSDLLLLDKDANILSRANEAAGAYDFSISAFERLRMGSVFDTGSIAGPGAKPSALAVLRRVDGPGGSFAGAVAALVGARTLEDAHAAFLDDSPEFVAVLGPGGTVALSQSWNAPSSRDRSAARESGALLSGYARLRSFPLQAVVAEDKSGHLSRYQRRFALAVAVSAGLALLFGSVALYAVGSLRALGRSAELQSELERREALYREVNHRIKNDLQIVRSILYLGMERVADGSEAANSLRAAESRIASISLVHEQLYRRSSSEANDLGPYVKELGAYLKSAYGADRRIEMFYEIDAGLSVPLDTAVTCGIILNELITNAFKYAFPDDRPGSITLGARRAPTGEILLTVRDDGIGLAADAETRNDKSFGLTLVETLARQTKAEIGVESEEGKGTAWTVRLPSAVISS